MTGRWEALRRWSPRVLGVLLCLFLSIFALAAFEPGKPPGRAIADFPIHLTPTAVMLVVVALSWRREWIGGVVFTMLARAYAWFAGEHPLWILTIGGPLLAVRILFLGSRAYGRRLRART